MSEVSNAYGATLLKHTYCIILPYAQRVCFCNRCGEKISDLYFGFYTAFRIYGLESAGPKYHTDFLRLYTCSLNVGTLKTYSTCTYVIYHRLIGCGHGTIKTALRKSLCHRFCINLIRIVFLILLITFIPNDIYYILSYTV